MKGPKKPLTWEQKQVKAQKRKARKRARTTYRQTGKKLKYLRRNTI